jgi:hypothetical protein
LAGSGSTATSVEWSEKHQCWCIEDAAGACLAHEEAIHGAAESKDAALALAEAMIRHGRMPIREEARWMRLPEAERGETTFAQYMANETRRRRAKEKRAQQPAQLRRVAEAQQLQEQENQAWLTQWQTEAAERREQPLYEVLSEIFDFADPELWKSNSFAALRPRLIVHLEAVVAELERRAVSRQRYATKQPAKSRRATDDGFTARLDRARNILSSLQQQ